MATKSFMIEACDSIQKLIDQAKEIKLAMMVDNIKIMPVCQYVKALKAAQDQYRMDHGDQFDSEHFRQEYMFGLAADPLESLDLLFQQAIEHIKDIQPAEEWGEES